MAGVFTQVEFQQARLVALQAHFAAGKGCAAEAHQLKSGF